jgi:lantibiotic biosynthesis protein
MSERLPITLERSDGMDWRPILHGDLYERALAQADAIAGDLRARADELTTPPAAFAAASLASGTAGFALFFAYLHQQQGRGRDRELAERFLGHALEAVASAAAPPSLFGGFTGVAWAAAHLDGWLEVPDLSEVDTALVELIGESPWEGEFDLISGLAGLGTYLLERRGQPGAPAGLALVADRLADTADRTAEGVRWLTRPDRFRPPERQEAPTGRYDLGVAHGTPGVVAFLGGACGAGVDRRELLGEAVRWVLAQRLPDGGPSVFPTWVGPGIKPQPARTAWCYGDAGVAAALLAAARAVGEKAWEREALRIARSAAARAPEQTGVADAGFCHGAAGLAHLFGRIFQATGDEAVLEGARRWYERTLAMAEPGAGVGEYRFYKWQGNGTFGWEADSGLLTGSAGVALSLLAAAGTVEPAWDRALLASIPAN